MANLNKWWANAQRGAKGQGLKIRGITDMPESGVGLDVDLNKKKPATGLQTNAQDGSVSVTGGASDMPLDFGGGGGFSSAIDFGGGDPTAGYITPQPQTQDIGKLGEDLKKILGLDKPKNKFAQIMDAIGTGAYGLAEASSQMRGQDRNAALMSQLKNRIGEPERKKQSLLEEILIGQLVPKTSAQERMYDRYQAQQAGLGKSAMPIEQFMGIDSPPGPMDRAFEQLIYQQMMNMF